LLDFLLINRKVKMSFENPFHAKWSSRSGYGSSRNPFGEKGDAMGKSNDVNKGTVYELPYGKVEAVKRRLFDQLGIAGARVVRALDVNFPAFTLVVQHMIDLVMKPVHWSRAEEIMGGHYLGTSLVSGCFGEKGGTWEDFSGGSGSVPFSEEMLIRCQKSHLLLAVFPLSIQEIVPPGTVFRVAPSIVRAKDSGPKWMLIRIGEVDNSLGCSEDDQHLLLTDEDEVPTARDIFFADKVWRYRSGKSLLRHGVNVRVKPHYGAEGPVRLVCLTAPFDGHVRDVQETHELPIPSVGLASCKKPLTA
jgi:hypothetical protein